MPHDAGDFEWKDIRLVRLVAPEASRNEAPALIRYEADDRCRPGRRRETSGREKSEVPRHQDGEEGYKIVAKVRAKTESLGSISVSKHLLPFEFQLLFEAAPNPYLILLPDRAFTIVAVNERYLAVTGTQRSAIVGQGVFEIFPDNPDDASSGGVSDLRASLNRVMTDRRQDVMGVQKYDIPRRDGSGEFDVRYWSPVNTPALSPTGDLLFIIHHVEDITEFIVSRERASQESSERIHKVEARAERSEVEVLRQAAELKEANRELKSAKEELERRAAELARLNEQLQEQDRLKNESLASALYRLDAHIDNSPLATIEFDPAFRVTRWSGTAEQLFGWRPEEIVGRALSELRWVHQDDLTTVIQVLTEMRSGLSPRNKSTNRNYRKDGSLFQCEWYNSAIYDGQGKLVSILSQALDVTERDRVVEHVRASEEKYRALFSNMTEGFALGEPILNEQGVPVDIRYLEANEAFYRHSGFPKDILGRPHREFLPEVEQLWIDRFAAVALTGQPDQIESYSAPTRRHYDVRAFCPSPGRFAIVFRDITEQKRVQEALLDSETRYKALFNNKTNAIAHCRVVTDEQGRPVDYIIEAVNDAYEQTVGIARKSVEGRPVTECFPGVENFDFDFIGEFGRIGLEGGEGSFEMFFPSTGQWFSLYAYCPKHGEFTAIFNDITAQKAAEAALKESEKRLALALKAAGTAVWEMDVATQAILPASDLFFTMLGYAPGDIRTSREWLALIHEDDLRGVPELIGDVIEGRRDSYWRELRLRTKAGRWHWILTQATAAERDAQGRAVRLIGMNTDIDERKLVDERVRAAALHDPLTGLPNRALLFEYGSHLVAAARRNHSHGALLFIDLDRFKPINDLYGHETGDRVLQEVGRRLVGCTRQEDVVGRLGGDEFVILLPHLDASRHRATAVAQHVVETIRKPFQLDALELSISPSIGISYYPEHATDVSALIHTADLAMYQAKQSGRSTYKFYAPELDRQVDEAYSLEAQLKNALKHGGLELHYQPVVDIQSGRLIGAEALARLIGNDGGMISPARFIPVAESAGLIEELGDWVAAEACRQHAAWLSEGLRVVIAINVSPLQFRQRDFARRLGRIVAENGVDPNGLQIEVTESTVMENVEEAIETLSQLKSIGVKVALDDFGTGYSSLSSLSSLPLDKLKVDQSFMRRVDSDPTSRAITRAMIALGRALNLEIVGEGIESEQTFGYLRSEGCDQAQGFWVSHPLPPAAFAKWTREQRLH